MMQQVKNWLILKLGGAVESQPIQQPIIKEINRDIQKIGGVMTIPYYEFEQIKRMEDGDSYLKRLFINDVSYQLKNYVKLYPIENFDFDNKIFQMELYVGKPEGYEVVE